jgi:hypothetical protein
MDMQSGGFQWKTAPSSTANSVITLSELMRLNANGNLLLNTTTDAGFRLDVNGTARFTGQITATTVVFGTVAQAFTFGGQAYFGTVGGLGTINLDGGVIRLGNNSNVTVSGVSLGQVAQNMLLGGTHISSSASIQSDILINTTLNFASSGYTYRGIWYNPTITSLGGNRHIAVETATGDVLLGTTSGSVAIGTSTLGTATKLTLGGSQTASSAIARGGLINTTLVAAANSDVLVGLDINPTFTNGAFTGVTNWAARFQGRVDVGANFIGNLPTNQYLHFTGGSGEYRFVNGGGSGWFYTWCQNSSTTERMRLSSSNNLLIGTTTDAGFRLDVNGTARVQSSLEVVSVNAGSSLIQQWSYSSAPSAYRLQLNTNVSTGIVKYSFDLLNNSTSFSNNLVLDRGNIGIGQISPLRRLDVASDGTNWGSAIFGGAGGTDKIQIGNLSSVATIAAVNSAASAFTNISIAPQGGNVLIGTSTDVASAVLQVSSTTKGFLPPRMTTTQRTAISSPAEGLIVVQTDGTQGLYLYIGAAWHSITML